MRAWFSYAVLLGQKYEVSETKSQAKCSSITIDLRGNRESSIFWKIGMFFAYCIAENFRQEFNFVAFVKAIF